MKKFLKFTTVLFLTILLNNCKEEIVGQYPTDSNPPQPVSNVIVKNIAGGASINYKLPDENDLLYVQALYNLPNGEKGITKSSVFSNSMLIKGFGKSQKRTIQLISVDRSKNESKPTSADIEPLDSPIYGILDSLIVQESFGGFKLTWPNSSKESIVLGVMKKNGTTGEFNYVDNFYSSEAFAKKAVRGLDSTRVTFAIFVKDVFGNYTDTLFMSLKPLFEQIIPKSGFVGLKLSTRFKIHSFGGPMSYMWDGITNVANNVFYIMTGNTVMPYFTFDMGVKAKLSRFRLWGRDDFLFALHNARLFEWYGTNDAILAADPETQGWETNPKWVKIMSGESKRPSGLPAGAAVTTEDAAYARAGEEFEFPLEAPAVRYLRFRLISTWSGSSGLHIGELTFWGQIEK